MRCLAPVSGLCALLLATGCGGGGGSSDLVNIANTAPVFTSSNTISIVENTVGTVYTAQASDADGNTITFRIAGGADANVVSLNAQTGALSFDSSLDFESPGDANADNVYEISLEARDGLGGVASIDLLIEITNQIDVVSLRRVGLGFNQPLGLQALPDGSGRVLVLEKTGRVRLLNPDTGNTGSVDFIDVSSTISTSGERGLLGLALSPDYATDGIAYLHVTNLAGDTEIRRFQSFSGLRDQLDPATSDVILTISQPEGNHNAGWIGFDAAGYFVFPTGDGGGSGDPSDLAQNPQSLLGKVLRIDVTSDEFPADDLRDYAIPPGNTFTDSRDGRPEIFAVGLRNPFQSSFDPTSGDLLIGDVGQGAIEEISRLPMTDSSLNFGWAIREGTAFFKGADRTDLTGPVAEYAHGAGPREGRSITGGLVYRGPVEALQDTYIFADFVSDNIWGVPVADLINGQTVSADRFTLLTSDFVPDQGSLVSIAAFGTDASNNLYVVSLGGDIFRLEAET